MVLKGKAALVTGAARRVGRAVALALAARGARIAVHYRSSRGEAEDTVAELRALGAEAALFRADLADLRQARALASAVWRRFGRLDVLVHSASLYERSPLGRVTQAQWDRQFDANVRAPFFLSQELGPRMKRAGAGKIIHLADWAALRPYADYAPYCASKAALLCLNTALAKALAPEVQVNAVLPGPVLLPDAFTRPQRRAVERATPAGRIGRPEDVARAVVYLAEEDFVTGARLSVDGGRLIA